ncbi:hypothetical protein F0P96_08760 [Hymenobacter busanensis]|uniref:Uncharacterized protein n=1 Tax=Hymenobacter busanensis TaxID=2607656 RepID=A0A7L5A4E3_9BACT|nr:hypothetical protein F0P96_08760 [Hymenobacter busanensis]QHJ09702.1 hypothetical protein GUY19_13565 [Hymenobacter busanensis]
MYCAGRIWVADCRRHRMFGPYLL